MPPLEKPRPTKPPKKPKPKRKTGQEEEVKKKPVMPERDSGGVPLLPQNKPLISCATATTTTYYGLCPPPPSPPATLHLRSARLPTALIALSASLLAVSAVLLLALLVRWLVRRRRRRGQEEEEVAQDDEESVMMGVAAAGGVVEEDVEEVDGGVHHVWFIRTKGLDERAIAAIAAVVYDASRKRGAGADGDGGCAVCLAEFRDGETLRLLPRCGHAFHRGCIDPWLRAHVNCPLCRAPVVVQVTTGSTTTAAAPRPRGEEEEVAANLGGARAVHEAEPRRALSERAAVRRAASMMALPRRAWPEDVSLQAPQASNSGREEDMTTGLAKIRKLLKLSEALSGIAAGRSVSFGAGTCQLRLPTRSGPSTAAGVNVEEIE